MCGGSGKQWTYILVLTFSKYTISNKKRKKKKIRLDENVSVKRYMLINSCTYKYLYLQLGLYLNNILVCADNDC